MVCELPACIAMWIKWSCSYYGIIDLLTLFVFLLLLFLCHWLFVICWFWELIILLVCWLCVTIVHIHTIFLCLLLKQILQFSSVITN